MLVWFTLFCAKNKTNYDYMWDQALDKIHLLVSLLCLSFSSLTLSLYNVLYPNSTPCLSFPLPLPLTVINASEYLYMSPPWPKRGVTVVLVLSLSFLFSDCVSVTHHSWWWMTEHLVDDTCTSFFRRNFSNFVFPEKTVEKVKSFKGRRKWVSCYSFSFISLPG